jgi:osmoprotectant transport system permease protein
MLAATNLLSAWMELLADRLPDVWTRIGEHLTLAGVAVACAVAIGVPLGILCHRYRRTRSSVIGTVSILQTIPSLAMLALLLAITGKIGLLPAEIALVLYALLPIVRNTLAGIEGVPDQTVEAARGMGMTRWQRLTRVELPLAGPVIIAGVRTAAVISVGIATLAAFIGAGGLGAFIFRGMSMMDIPLILLGAIPAAVLALLVDGAIWCLEWSLRPLPGRDRHTWKAAMRKIAWAAPVALVVLGVVSSTVSIAPPRQQLRSVDGQRSGSAGTVRIGSKDFAEQLLLGELMAQMIEARTRLTVERQFNLGGTMICHEALRKGEIDLYAEYTGTGYQNILGQDNPSTPQTVYETVDREYRRQFAADWLEPFGFNNTYAITVRKADAEKHGWATIADLAPQAGQLTAGFTSEFQERQDGYPGLSNAYGFRFGKAIDMSPALMPEALAKRQVDVICAFATDGRIAAYNLQPLRDNRNFFPPYDAAPVIRQAFLDAHPETAEALAPLGGLIDDATMQKLNYQVEGEKRRPRDVAREFLQNQGLLAR